jgi:hypothetical protein
MIMAKLICAAALVWLVTASSAALAQSACQQRCIGNCSGKGNMCLNKCETRCAIYGTAKRG